MEYNKKYISSRFLKRTYPTFKRRHAELREEQVDQLTGESGAILSPRQATA